jgi:hypothetical protein
LQELFRDLGLAEVSCRAIEIPMVFRDFADYWNPFLGNKERHPVTSLVSLMKHANGAARFYTRASHLPPMEQLK